MGYCTTNSTRRMARSLLLMAFTNEHHLTLAITVNINLLSVNTLILKQCLLLSKHDLEKIVSRLAILGVVIAQEDLNSKFLSSLPPEWNTHVVVWMNKAEIETMSIDDLYNNFKIVEQSVKKSVGASSGAQNLAFMTAPSTSSTNDVNTAKPAYEVSTASPNVNTASPQVSTASFSDNVVYAFMIENPNGSNLLQQDLEQIHEDDLEAMDLKWQLSLLSMRAKRYYQRTCKKIFINANDTAGYDKSKVECFNCHKMGHFARECRASRNKEGQFRNQDNIRKHGNNEDTSSKAMLAIYGVCFYWSDMAEEQVQTNMALMAFSDSKVYNDKTCLKNYETLKKQCDDLIVKLNQTEFTAATYKRGLATVEEQLITYRKNEAHCKYHQRERMVYGNNYTTNRTHLNAQRNMVPRAVLMKTGLKPFNTARTVNTAHPKSTVFSAKPMSCFSKSAQSTVKRPYQSKTVLTNKNFTQKNNTAKAKAVNTARPKAVNTARPHSTVVNAVRVNQANAVKASACWGKPQQDDTGFIDSGCSRHMTGNIAYLSDFKEFDGESKTSRHVKRGRDTKIPQSSGPPVKVGDEAVHKELGEQNGKGRYFCFRLEDMSRDSA
ncbi:ribonuclease H-like domain-containing protein [Tanacetum coccineum]